MQCSHKCDPVQSNWFNLFAILFAFVVGAAPLHADEPTFDSRLFGFVLLTNGNVLSGNAIQKGEFIHVSRAGNSELILDREDVACWSSSLRDLYQYRVDRRPSDSPRDRLRDAEFCLEHELYDLAAAELRAIYQDNPSDADGKRFEERLNAAISLPPSSSREVPSKSEMDRLERLEEMEKWMTPRVVHQFAKQIQPLLLNRCGQCHSSNQSIAWSIDAPSGLARPSSKMTRRNLRSTMAFIEPGNPESSRLLMMGQSEHGGATARLTARHHIGLTQITQWIATMRELDTQTARRHSSETSKRNSDPQNGVTQAPSKPFAKWAGSNLEDSNSIALSTQASFETRQPKDSAPPSVPKRLPKVDNPFDPDLFNRRFGKR